MKTPKFRAFEGKIQRATNVDSRKGKKEDAGPASNVETEEDLPSYNSDEEVILFSGRKQLSEHRKPKPSRSGGVKDAYMDDYIANVLENNLEETDDPPLATGAKPQLDVAEKMPEYATSNNDIDFNMSGADDWGSVELQDFEDISTSSETMNQVPRILRRRQRLATIQYLVVATDESIDEARWLPRERMAAENAGSIIEKFEEALEARQEAISEDDDEDADDWMSADDVGSPSVNLNSSADDKDLEERREIRVSDEQIARLLAKQAELGMPDDDLLLYNGEGLLSESSADGIFERETMPFRTSKKVSKTTRRVIKSSKNDAYAAFLDSEDYGAFDIMDRERPSIEKKSKKTLKQEDLGLSDPELFQQISSTWEHDRNKKKARKQQREELRAQGLLGRKGKPDLKAKYREGLDTEDLKSEIKGFLMSPTETLPLPPMDAHKRKIIHDMAHRLSMNSKSRGHGSDRFPVLIKTSRTKMHSRETIAAIIDQTFSSKRYMPRPPKGKVASVRRERTVGTRGAASFRDGEVVGVGAPELGKENRGRAMLEKMGWSNGTALGAMNNKGIIEPVAQVVKTTKAGLG